MALPESDQRELFAPTADVVRADFPLTPPERRSKEKDPWSILRIFRSPRHAREHRPENGSEQGPPAVIVRRSATINKSRRSRPQTQAHMGSS